MSQRAQYWFGKYVQALRVETEGTPAEEEAKADCILLLNRLESTFGHIEHEILVDEIKESLEEKR